MAEQEIAHRINGIDLDVLQQTVEAIQQDPGLAQCKFRARNKWIGDTRNRSTISEFFGARQEQSHKTPFELLCDEPPVLAGQDSGPNPVEHLLNALAGCITTSLVAHAAVRGIEIQECESELEGDLDLRGFLGLSSNVPKGYTAIRVKMHVKSDDRNLDKIKRLTDFSPVLNTLSHGVSIDVQFEPK